MCFKAELSIIFICETRCQFHEKLWQIERQNPSQVSNKVVRLVTFVDKEYPRYFTKGNGCQVIFRVKAYH